MLSREGQTPPPIILEIPRAFLPVLALIGLVLLATPLSLAQRNRALRAELAGLSDDLAGTKANERDLEDALVRQHHQLQTAEQTLTTVDRQIAAIELQLDGVDFLAGQLREELGLPPGTGTWDAESQDPSAAQGGSGTPAMGEDRLALVHRRLLAGFVELQALQARAEQNRAAAAGTGASAPALPEARFSRPANWPARGKVTSDFGWRVFRGRPDFHTGIDIGLPYGSPVQVTGDGMVAGSGWQPSFGWSVLVDHGQGYSTLYAHLSQSLTRVGARLSTGDAIGLSGSSGNSTGPHLHYEIWKDGHVLDPRPLMDGPAVEDE